jgi:uncharacterized protein (TIGR02453 family)
MKGTFPGFSPKAIGFLRDLKKHNDRDWFNPRKETFEELIRQPLLELVSAVHREMMRFAPEYVGEPAKCAYRIYRDTRFSKDKTPYKTHLGALLWRNGLDKNAGSAYYFAISTQGIEVAGGLYSPEPDMLLAVRRQIERNPDEFRKTFDTRRIRRLVGELKGERLSRVPKGFDAGHPAAELLKHKRYILYVELGPEVATSRKLVSEIVKRFEMMAPFVEYLNRPLLKQHAKRRRDDEFLR